MIEEVWTEYKVGSSTNPRLSEWKNRMETKGERPIAIESILLFTRLHGLAENCLECMSSGENIIKIQE